MQNVTRLIALGIFNRGSNFFTVNGQRAFDRNVVKDSWFRSVTSGQPGVQPS